MRIRCQKKRASRTLYLPQAEPAIGDAGAPLTPGAPSLPKKTSLARPKRALGKLFPCERDTDLNLIRHARGWSLDFQLHSTWPDAEFGVVGTDGTEGTEGMVQDGRGRTDGIGQDGLDWTGVGGGNRHRCGNAMK